MIGELECPTLLKGVKEKLQRWGFNPQRECCLHSPMNVDKLLVRIPGEDQVFPCVDYRDRMHGIYIFFHRVVLEILNEIGVKPKKKRILDERLAKMCSSKCFRDHNGRAFRTQKSVFEDTGMTAADKISWMFLLPHVLGHTADFMPAPIHDQLLTAIAHIQLIFIAVSGNRAYSRSELETIFDRGYLVIFGAFEYIRAQLFHARYLRHSQDPSRPRPKRIKLATREWKDFTTPNTDTDDTDEDVKVGGLGHYSHGNYSLLHQHYVEQVISAGGLKTL
jgi:hypothetical protein